MSHTKESGFYANLSFVDFVGLPVGMQLSVVGGPAQRVLGIDAAAITKICSLLHNRTVQEGQPWRALCQSAPNGTPRRVISPGKYISTHPSAFSDYYLGYVDAVWKQYLDKTLVVDPQNGDPDIRCSTSSGLLACEGASRPLPKPGTGEIFGCDGVFATQPGDSKVTMVVLARVCAAMHRSTMLMPGGQRQPQLSAASYYRHGPTNWYSHAVHAVEVDSKGYAFPYDDVVPNGGPDSSGAVASAQPDVWTVVVGGYSESVRRS
jgi:hypothetical protein